MKLAYFAHELTDPAVQRRIALLAGAGAEIALLGFERGRFADAPAQVVSQRVLGRTAGGKFAQRILAVSAAIPRALRFKADWAGADVILARNLEMLAIACAACALAGARTRIVYECLDIHRLMLKRGPAGAILRAIERACLRRAALTIVSSPAFERAYFRAIQKHEGPILLAENKPLEAGAAAARPAAGPPWRIAWCGVLRCRRSFDLLLALSERAPNLVRVDLYGAPAEDQIPGFEARLAGAQAMAFHGRYQPGDLARIYGAAHFAWAIDFFEAGGNSDWLLPNRLYESLAHGAVPIAVSGVETAAWLAARDVGVTLGEPLAAQLEAFLAGLTPQAATALVAGVAALPRTAVAWNAAEARALAAALQGKAA